MGKGDDGFVVTENHLLWRNVFLEPNSLLWSDLTADQIALSSDGVLVKGHKIQIHLQELRQPVVRFFQRMTHF